MYPREWKTRRTLGPWLNLGYRVYVLFDDYRLARDNESWCAMTSEKQIPTHSRFKPTRTEKEVEERFHALLTDWRNRTRLESNYAKIMTHPSFRRILALGPQAVPYILQDMKTGHGGAWFQALEDITGENPIAPEHEVDSSLMIEDWLEWGRRNGII